MLKYKLIGIALFLKAFIGKLDFEAARLDVDQSKKYYSIERVARLSLPEMSGLTTSGDTLYTLTDSGGEAAIYKVGKNNIIIRDTLFFPNTSNIDWEALTTTGHGAFFIGDIGNNRSNRRNLRIYIVDEHTKHADTISLSYAEQPGFPPAKKYRNYDSEAMFWHEGQLHIFSKNWGRKCVKHYILPDKPGEYELVPKEELKLNSMITGAAISPGGKVVVLSAYGKLYFFLISDGLIFNDPLMLIETTRFGQNEGVTFLNDKTLLVSNEAGKFLKVTFSLPENK